ncbi:hypothetical protein MGMO_44c00370 [Methyloglobulus morosus KoM1]|uniref:Uncharacterized protein n=1 Tax=Methyloglobulus morosus KoM1 TaxID=1116472 RepID=V5C345_9GAMM|nr:hypothetical protein [Methyloglobulus morosus]ESS72887.1 hypothetical protein MGMO_44c00370 [Methyloglobulus morosus KoM1]
MPKSTNYAALVLGAITVFTAMETMAESDYRCTVGRVAMASTKSATILAWEEKIHIGKQFTVERQTGLMAGILKNSFTTKPVVIDVGSKDNSYKVVTTMRLDEGAGFGSNIYALTINEYAYSSQKPFVFLNNDVVYLGECEHF